MAILLRPKILNAQIWSLRNAAKQNFLRGREALRDWTLLLFALLVMLAIYFGSLWCFQQMNSSPHLSLLPPLQPLGIIFLSLFMMLLISNLVAALDALYYGHDLDLLLAAPLHPVRFFCEKLLSIAFNSSWTSVIFFAPLIAAVGVSMQAGWLFYLCALFTLVAFLLIPAAIAVLAATLFTKLFPPRRRGIVLAIVAGLFLLAAASAGELVAISLSSSGGAQGVYRFLRTLDWANTLWLPSSWLTLSLEYVSKGEYRALFTVLMLCFSSLLALGCFSYLIFQLLYLRSFSAAKASYGHNLKSTFSESLDEIIQFGVPNCMQRALIGKELRYLSREMSNLVQLLILAGLCFIYLANLRMMRPGTGLSEELQDWWNMFFFVSNWALGAFVTTGICTRLVYPSVSLEGQCLWILQSAPLKFADLVRAKFLFWYAPVASISAAVLALGAISIGASAEMILVNAFSGILLAYGVVGLAIGNGSRYARFNWEHASQLAAGVGTIIFMLKGVVFIFVNALAIWFFTFPFRAALESGLYHEEAPPLSIMCGLIGLAVLNYWVAAKAVQNGTLALEEKLAN